MAAESKQPKNEPEAMDIEEDEETKQLRLEKETTASVIAGNTFRVNGSRGRYTRALTHSLFFQH